MKKSSLSKQITKMVGLVGIALAPQLAAAQSNQTMTYENEYVVTRRADSSAGPRSQSARRNSVEVVHYPANALRSTKGRRLVRLDSVPNHCAELKAADPSIATCDPNHEIKASITPNDARFTQLWGLRNTTGGPDIAATSAWNVTTGSRTRSIVAVVDTGIDYTHPDLAANAWVNPNEIAGNGIDDDGNGYVDDVHGINAITSTGDPMDDNSHGTHVSGTIGAAGNNSTGVVGVNWEAQIIGAKFLDASGSGDLASEVRALNYVGDLKQYHGIDIVAVNASYGSSSSSTAEYNAILRLRNLGILFMAAAGNDSANNDTTDSFPANFALDNIISVAAIDISGNLASFSNYGVSKVHIAAPGDGIVSTIPGNRYASYSGTSMATPHVTGAAGLLKAAHPEYSMAQIRQQLLTYGTPYPTLAGVVATGKILNVAAMLNATMEPAPPPAPQDPSDDPADEPADEPSNPDGSELFDIAVGGNPGASQKVFSNRSTAYIALAHDAQSVAASEVAYLRVTMNGYLCPQIVSASVEDGSYVLVSGKFKDLKRTAAVTVEVLNEEGTVTGSDSVLVVDRKDRGRQDYAKACRSFFRSLRYAN